MRRLYNRIHKYYGAVERTLGPKIDVIIRTKITQIPHVSEYTALEYACGSGLLTLKLAPHFKSVTGRDLSSGMLARAAERAEGVIGNVSFREGDICSIDETDGSYDYVFVSFALHLFPPVQEKEILQNLLSVSRKGVIIIDHGRRWSMKTAFVEWLEGSYYDRFIKTDFSAMADAIGCSSFDETDIEDCLLMTFEKGNNFISR
jgi:ubiquinone/menaquinone biosynthesis C-methylase UbiE